MESAWLAEQIAVVATKVGAPLAATPLETAYIKLGDKFRKVMAICNMGLPKSDADVDVAVWQASASDGTGEAILKAATQRGGHATDNDNKIIIVEVDMDDVEAGDASKPWVALRMTISTEETTPTAACLVMLAGDARNQPLADIDDSDIVEIKR